jgi:RimJ/RimL family protein N-acetyltransferase
MMITRTERIELREFVADDLEETFRFMGDPVVMEYSLRGPYSREDTRAFLDRCALSYRERGMGLWALVHRQSRELFGYCGFFFQVVDGEDEVELGFRLRPDYWGRGLATEAARACRDLAFHRFGLKRLISLIEAENTSSSKVAVRVGMHLEKETLFKNIPVHVYAMVKGEGAA